ncbi:MAG: hypothetical protein ACYC8T_10365 [Myxococcaceae bacterium]
MMRTLALPSLLLAFAALVACGPKPRPIPDSGPEDAGEDAGVDAGRPAGEMPPTGYTRAVVQPDAGALTTRVGIFATLALDQNGQPMLAYVHQDPNGDGVRQDDKVVFTRWNGEDKGWQPPKTVEVCGAQDDAAPHRQLSLARDDSTGRLGLAYVTAAQTVKLASSDDEGQTWSLEVASVPNPNAHPLGDPQLKMAGGKVHLAYWEASARCGGAACGTVHYRTRQGQGPGGFSADVQAPLVAGAQGNMAMPLSMALDSAGAPGLAYFVETSASSNVTLAFWRPGAVTATAIFDSAGTADPGPSVSLAFFGDLPRVAAHLSGADPVQLRYVPALDAAGTTWGAPVGIDRNGATGSPESTRYFQSLAIDPAGKVAIAAAFTGATQAIQQCGGPKLARSAGGTLFTVCSPDGGRFFGFAGTFANLAVGRGNKLWLSFLYESTSNQLMGPGVVVWREP